MNQPITIHGPTQPGRHSKWRVWLAWAIAVGADALQLGGFAVFSEGALLPFDAALDFAVAIALTVLIGWHIVFIPTILIEALPFADLAPTWTLAVLIATRGKNAKPDLLPAK